MNALSIGNSSRFMDKMFRKADGVVWDLMSGKIGVMTEDGIATLDGEGEDARVSINIMDEFGIALPAFAQSTPVAGVKVGDIIYRGKTNIAWITAVNVDKGTFRVMKPNGESSAFNPPKVSMLGFESGVMVLRSLITMLPGGDKGLGQMQNTLLPMMMMSGGNMGGGLEKMMPLMLMSQMNSGGDPSQSNGMGNMMQTMMMMSMLKGGDSNDMFSGMFGGDDSAPRDTNRKSPFNRN